MPSISQPAAASAAANPVEEQLYRKVLWRILPILLLCYVVAYLDCSGLICPDTSIGGQSTIRGVLHEKAAPQFRHQL